MNKSEIRRLMEMIAQQKLGAKEAFTCYRSGFVPQEEAQGKREPICSRDAAVGAGIDEIAIVGVSGRFPDANNVEEFWSNLAAGRDSVHELSKGRFDLEPYYDPDPNAYNKTISKWGGQLQDIDKFDPLFFNISSIQAEYMDPRQRVFLEEAWKAIEDACMSDRYLKNKKCAVFVGCEGSTDYFGNTGAEPSAQYFLGYSNSILAARISYFLDLKGPSITIDTGCSSSLVAIHLACESLRRGESEIVLAGGIQIMTRPKVYVMLSKIGMLSPTGKCRTFDDSADGMVPGEAAGVVVLKRLKDAVRDGNHIYGVIAGTGINQDGKTNGITAPNAISQTQLECDVYDRFGINPKRISYVEAHGTGTALGDPIEIEALRNAFARYSRIQGCCAIGSVKTNIGHTFAASGAVSLIKVLMCLKYKKIPPSLHFSKQNRHIDFENSPFFINTNLNDWNVPIGLLRQAAISSFGHSGTNSHLVVREYTSEEGKKAMTRPFSLIVLSAKTKEALQCRIVEFGNWLKAEGASKNLEDISYSLLTGRSFFQYRCAFVADSISELQKMVDKTVEDGFNTLDGILSEKAAPDTKQLENTLIEELNKNNVLSANDYGEKLKMLASLFVRGCDIAFEGLFKDSGCKYIPLPKYPFARETYWLSEVGSELDTDRNDLHENSMLHPLIGKNVSTLTECRFSTLFSGKEYFLKDHKIKGKMVLPGAVITEMALAAASLADNAKRWNEVSNLRWMSPVVLEKSPLEVQVVLKKENEGCIKFEIGTEVDGIFTVGAYGEIREKIEEMLLNSKNKISVEEIIGSSSFDCEGEGCYTFLHRLGADLGSSFQGLKHIWVTGGEVVGRIELPAEARNEYNNFHINPVILDSAFQTVTGFIGKVFNTSGQSGSEMFSVNKDMPLLLPYSMRSLVILNAIPTQCYVYATVGKGLQNENTRAAEFDVLILSEKGDIVAKIEGFTVMRLDLPEYKKEPVKCPKVKFCTSVWERSDFSRLLAGNEENNIHPIEGSTLVFDTDEEVFRTVQNNINNARNRRYVILVKPGDKFRRVSEFVYEVEPGNLEDFKALTEELKSWNVSVENIIYLWPLRLNTEIGNHPGDILRLTYFSVLLLCQMLMELHIPEVRILYIYRNMDEEARVFDKSMGAFAKTLEQENPGYRLKTLGMAETNGTNNAVLMACLSKELMTINSSGEFKYDKEIRYEKCLLDMDIDKHIPSQNLDSGTCFRDSGVYIITGGLGGIGFLVAGYLAERVGARLVLSGRTGLDEKMQTKLTELSAKGGQAVYVKADCSARNEVNMLVKTAHEYFGSVNGIIHCAGLVRDSYIINKMPEESFQVFAPKVFGALNLDQALKNEGMDFFIMFSSLSAVMGNAGQSDYAFANAFMDGFSDFRERLRLKGERFGKTISINWPFWKDGGMSIDNVLSQIMEEKFGIIPLETEKGIEALEAITTSVSGQVAVIPFVEEMYDAPPPIIHELSSSQDIMGSLLQKQYDSGTLKGQTEQFLKELIATQTRIPIGRLDIQEAFENYGIDSTLITRLNFELEKSIPGLSKTLFFEYRNIKQLAEYFLNKHEAALGKLFNKKPEIQRNSMYENKKQSFNIENIKTHIQPHQYPDVSSSLIASTKKELEEDEIAIVGVSGKYPMADNLEEFWNNLVEGKDCITEVPKERWDHSLLFNPDKDRRGSIYSKWGGFINGVDEFDPVFFKISPREAEMIDPQERIFLQCAYHTLEDAGYTAAGLGTKCIGVFVGVMYGQYQLFGVENSQHMPIALSSSYASVANRVSYFFDFQGPSMAVDTMCSSSLTSIHLACESIRKGECELALAGGVNITIHPSKHLLLCSQKFASSDGRCRSFGEGGDGYVPSEGVGAILLKSLSRAKADNDNIYAVIKGSSLNHCGRTNGYTIPDPGRQSALIFEALTSASLNPGSIGYIEAHGTGTSLGDPIEISGLEKAFDSFNPDPGKLICPVGSVKSNIGHLESAAGIAGVTKVLLMMRNRKLVPSIHSEYTNPNINFEDSYFYVNQSLKDWEKKTIYEGGRHKFCPRIAGISSFGAGGSNAHVILEEYEEYASSTSFEDNDPQIIVLSAMSKEQLRDRAISLIDYLNKKRCDPLVTLRNVAFTLQVGRESMKLRLAVVAYSLEEAIGALQQYYNCAYTGKNLFTNVDTYDISDTAESAEETIDTLIGQKDLPGLAKVWVSGTEVKWEKLYPVTKPRRIALPNYPFKRKRCWFDGLIQDTGSENSVIQDRPSKTSFIPGADWEKLAADYNGSEVTCTIIDEHIALVKIQDKPNRNMFTKEVVAGLIAAFDTIRKNEKIKTAIVTGYDNIFCMGGTQEALNAISEDRAEFTDIPFLYKGLLESNIPIITAIQGHAFGGGLLFGLYGDITVMADEGLYCANFMNFGFTPGMGATFILEKKLGGMAAEMMFTGKTYRGEEIKDRGGSSLIFASKDNVLDEALNIARVLAVKPKQSLQALKTELAGRLLAGLEEILERERLMHKVTFGSSEVKYKIKKHFRND